MNFLEMKKKAIASFANKIKGFLRNSSSAPPISLEFCADTTAIFYMEQGSYSETYCKENGFNYKLIYDNTLKAGTTEARPINPPIGFQYFNTEIGHPIWYNGTNWVSSLGTEV
mgnify:CR=1 FL=1